jgi:hypothetical protein
MVSLPEALITSLSTTDCDPLRKCISSNLLGRLPRFLLLLYTIGASSLLLVSTSHQATAS